VASDARVCPFCGEPPGSGVFCASCGRNLADVERLPTRGEWTARADTTVEPDATPVAGVDAFLAAMRAAGDPGVQELAESRPGFLGRTRHARGWIVRAAERDPEEPSTGYAPGVFLSIAGRAHRLESSTSGWGQRGAPHYVHLVGPELEASDIDREDLLAGLGALLAAHVDEGGQPAT
jgi:hypothetical protein